MDLSSKNVYLSVFLVTIMADKDAPSEPQKYRRREVISNWSRYEELPPDEELEDGEDYMIGEDFSTILEQQGKCLKFVTLVEIRS